MSIENVEAGIVGQGPDRKTIHLGNLPRGVDKARVEKVLKEKVALEVQPIKSVDTCLSSAVAQLTRDYLQY